jgi:DNA-binding MarR family transcriptional regulator
MKGGNLLVIDARLLEASELTEGAVETLEQAAELECLLPKLMRRLFTLQDGSLVSELPLAQLRLCTILQAGPRSMTTLAEELSTSVSAVTQIADRLERAGLVERVLPGPEADDRRMKLLRLTASGSELMHARRERRVQRVNEVLEKLVPAERAVVLQAVRALVEASRDSAPGSEP